MVAISLKYEKYFSAAFWQRRLFLDRAVDLRSVAAALLREEKQWQIV